MSLYRSAAIVGAAEALEIGYPEEPKTGLQLHMEAIHAVTEQTGIPVSAIEGVFSAGASSEIAEHLGIHPKYIDTTSVGGCSFEMHVHHAMAAIHAGIIDIALITHGQNGWSQRRLRGGGGFRGGGGGSPSQEMTMSYGLSGAPSNYAHAMTAHNHRYGTTPEDFAHIAVVTREWATLNPRAVMYSRETHEAGGPITVADVNNARVIAWPLTLLHCCLVTDHGGAVIVARPEVARSVKTTPVWIAGCNGDYYVFSEGKAGKVKRIRANGRARIAACDLRGNVKSEWIDATARIVTDPREIEAMYAAFAKKYGWQMAVGNFLARLSGRFHKRAIIGIHLA